MLLPGGPSKDARQDRVVEPASRIDVEPIIGVSAVVLGGGSIASFYLIFTAPDASFRSVVTATALLVAVCSCFVSLFLLGRFRRGPAHAPPANSAPPLAVSKSTSQRR